MSESNEHEARRNVLSDTAYVTLVLSDDYVVGARVVANELHRLDLERPVLCLVARGCVSSQAVAQLGTAVDEIVFVDAIDAGDSAELRLLDRPELRFATTKIWLWALPFKRVVYLDADTLPVAPLSELFDLSLPDSRHLGAAPDCGWPDLFNSGVLVVNPDRDVATTLVSRLHAAPVIDGSDQGLFNEEFKWVRIPFLYNVTVNASYEYAPAYNKFKNNVKVLHFIGTQKPWATGAVNTSEAVAKWWAAFRELPGAPNEPSMQYESAIAAPPDYWDATTHAPFKSSRPEGEILDQRLSNLSVADEPEELHAPPPSTDVHTFPIFGPSLVELPFERQRRRRPERRF